jgi:hypothetical protein
MTRASPAGIDATGVRAGLADVDVGVVPGVCVGFGADVVPGIAGPVDPACQLMVIAAGLAFPAGVRASTE